MLTCRGVYGSSHISNNLRQNLLGEQPLRRSRILGGRLHRDRVWEGTR